MILQHTLQRAIEEQDANLDYYFSMVNQFPNTSYFDFQLDKVSKTKE